MEARQLRRGRERRLEPHVLRGAELALKHKLRRKFGGEFTSRHAEDLIAQAAREYASAEAGGERIENPGGFLVDVAYKRAIDELRHEKRTPELDELSAAVALPDPAAAEPVEEVEHEELRSQIYEAISHLDPEERQVIALVLFEEMSGRETAGPLGVSETTALRRLRSASAKMREWLPAIEQGSFCAEAASQLRALAEGTAEGLEAAQAKLHLENCAACRETMARREAFGFEVGLAAWLSLASAASAQSRLGDRLAGLAEATRHAFAVALERARDLSTRVLSSGGGEATSGVASGPMGKAAGACAAALAACAVTGVIGPGVGGIDLGGSGHKAATPKSGRVTARRAPAPVAPVRRTPILAPAAAPTQHQAKHKRSAGGSESQAAASEKAATAAATEQFGIESAAGSPETESSPPPPPESSSSSSSGPSPTQIANEQFGP